MHIVASRVTNVMDGVVVKFGAIIHYYIIDVCFKVLYCLVVLAWKIM